MDNIQNRNTRIHISQWSLCFTLKLPWKKKLHILHVHVFNVFCESKQHSLCSLFSIKLKLWIQTNIKNWHNVGDFKGKHGIQYMKAKYLILGTRISNGIKSRKQNTRALLFSTSMVCNSQNLHKASQPSLKMLKWKAKNNLYKVKTKLKWKTNWNKINVLCTLLSLPIHEGTTLHCTCRV